MRCGVFQCTNHTFFYDNSHKLPAIPPDSFSGIEQDQCQDQCYYQTLRKLNLINYNTKNNYFPFQF